MEELRRTLTPGQMSKRLGVARWTVLKWIKAYKKDFISAGALKERESMKGNRIFYRIIPEKFVEVLKEKGVFY